MSWRVLQQMYRNPQRARAVEDGKPVDYDWKEVDLTIRAFLGEGSAFAKVILYGEKERPVVVVYPEYSRQELKEPLGPKASHISGQFSWLFDKLECEAGVKPSWEDSSIVGLTGSPPRHLKVIGTWKKANSS